METLAASPFPVGAPSLFAVLYTGTWGDGVFRITDHGATWQPVNTSIKLSMYLQGGLAANPITLTILYAGDYYGAGSTAAEPAGIPGPSACHVLPSDELLGCLTGVGLQW